jgi:hypothetical protein
MRSMLTAIFALYAASATAQTLITEGPGITSKSGSVTFNTTDVAPSWYQYQPKNDITAYELAIVINLLLPAITCRHYFDDCGVVKSIDEAPPEVRRHFVKHEN